MVSNGHTSLRGISGGKYSNSDGGASCPGLQFSEGQRTTPFHNATWPKDAKRRASMPFIICTQMSVYPRIFITLYLSSPT